jgi:hypothetical protein
MLMFISLSAIDLSLYIPDINLILPWGWPTSWFRWVIPGWWAPTGRSPPGWRGIFSVVGGRRSAGGVLVATYPSLAVGGLCNVVVEGSSRPWGVPPLWSNVRGVRSHLSSHTWKNKNNLLKKLKFIKKKVFKIFWLVEKGRTNKKEHI